ncbi:MAG: hypothetical protein Q9166_007636 [cf. Caloplaca sp. 2 TL-2023]
MNFAKEFTSTIVPQATPRRILPKRKRKETSYYPSDSDSDPNGIQVDDYDSEAERVPSSKKMKFKAAAESTKPLPKKKIFAFMSLPAELKNKIYSLALTCDHEVALVSRIIRYRHRAELGTTETFQAFRRRRDPWGYRNITPNMIITPSFVPNLLALNHQINAETQPILYGANVFAFENTKALHTFCTNIGPRNGAALRELTIKHWGDTKAGKGLNYPAFTSMIHAVNLTRLNLDCEVAWGGRGDKIARQIYGDGHDWLEAVGRSKGQKDAAVDLITVGFQNILSYRADATASEEEKRKKMDRLMISFRAELRRLLM